MFPKLTYSISNRFSNPGLLAESLLFYQTTNLILDQKTFPEVLKYIGYSNMVELIREGDLEVRINFQSLGVANPKQNLFQLTAWNLLNSSKASLIKNSMETFYGRNFRTLNHSKHLIRIISEHEYSEEYQRILEDEVSNPENLSEALRISSKGAFNNDNTNIEIEEVAAGLFKIISNVSDDEIMGATYIITAATGLIFNSEIYKSELLTNATLQLYPTFRINRILNKRRDTEEQINHFHEIELPYYCDLKSTMDSGVKSFDDYMLLWREAKRFKDALKDADPNVELLSWYLDELKKVTWLGSLPVKVARWLIFTGIGHTVGDVGGTVTGAALNQAVDILDNFVLDGLLKTTSWKPNQFVDGDYTNFLNFGMEGR